MTFRPALVVLFCFGLSSCGRQLPSGTSAVYSETMDFAAVAARIGMLRAHQLDLYQVLEPSHIGSRDLEDLIKACEREGVGFRAWLVLPRSMGLWPNETNLPAFSEALTSFLDWIHEEDLPVGWITFDLEPSWEYTQQLMGAAREMTSPARFPELLALFRAHHAPAQFRENQAFLSRIVDQVHDAGLRAHAVTYPMVVDDAADDDADIQDAFDIPVTGISWDEVSLMVYRSTWEGFANGPLSEDLLFAYGREVMTQFGAAGAIDLGVVGEDPITLARGYLDPAVLERDVAAARAAGVERLHLYSLENVALQQRPEAWLGFAATQPGSPPAPDRNVERFRSLFTVLDAILSSP